MSRLSARLVILALLGAACSDGAAHGRHARTATDAAPDEAATAGSAIAGLTDAERARPVDADGLRAILAELPPRRAVGTEAHRATREWIESTLRRDGYDPLELPFTWAGAEGAELVNLEARLPGASLEAAILIVSAHYDSVAVTPGADDNGSGVSGLLELARRLSGRRFQAEVRLVFFDCEEAGLIGSGAYVRDLQAGEHARMLGVINLETLGYTDRSAASQRLPPGAGLVFDPGDRGDFLMIVGNLQSALLASVVQTAMAAEAGPGFRAEAFSALPGAGWLLPDSRRSDHARFWDAGIPALMLTDTANLRSPHYHRPTDTIETLDLEFLAAAIRGVERATITLAVPLDD